MRFGGRTCILGQQILIFWLTTAILFFNFTAKLRGMISGIVDEGNRVGGDGDGPGK